LHRIYNSAVNNSKETLLAELVRLVAAILEMVAALIELARLSGE